jgi:RHS repeat-associated protein
MLPVGVLQNSITLPAQGDLQFEYLEPDNPPAAGAPPAYLSANSLVSGGLNIAGKYTTILKHQITVAYVDNEVYEALGTSLFEYKYALVGSEGKAWADDRLDYYIKDHLGSTRVVVDAADLNIKESSGYQAYGTEKTLATTTMDDVAREKFTGKELDKEGNTGCFHFDITITGFATIPVTVTEADAVFTINYAGGTSSNEYMAVNHLTSSVSYNKKFYFAADKAINTLRIRITETTPEINCVVTFDPSSALSGSAKLGDSVVVRLNATAADLNGGGATEYVTEEKKEGAYCGVDLGYFGKRYFDSEMGVWNSTDPKMQFFSLYSYTGNFHNPINSIDQDGLDAWVLNEKGAVWNLGHSAILVGNKETGYHYFCKEGNIKVDYKVNGKTKQITKAYDTYGYFKTLDEFEKSIDPARLFKNNDVKRMDGRYNRQLRLIASPEQDQAMIDKANSLMAKKYSAGFYNCADLVGDVLEAGGLNDGRGIVGTTMPDLQYDVISIKKNIDKK